MVVKFVAVKLYATAVKQGKILRNKTVIGQYNNFGYTIFHVESLKELHIAGNHSQDGSQVVSLNHPNCLPLNMIRRFCIKTGKEIAKEKGYRWASAERISNEQE